MGKIYKILSKDGFYCKVYEQSTNDVFAVIYNHRRIVRAKALKKMKILKHKRQEATAKLYQQSLQNSMFKNLNRKMFEDDLQWQNVYQEGKKQLGIQESNLTNSSSIQQKLDKVRLQIIYSLYSNEKRSLYCDKFCEFKYDEIQENI